MFNANANANVHNIQAVRNAGGKSEKEEDVEQEEQKELDDMEEIETVESNSQESPSSELEDSCLDESDIEEIESTAPLISDEEAEAGMEEGKKVGYGEERLTREHKMKLLLTKGSVIVVSCLVLLVGVVLAGVLRYDYSLCDSEDMDVHLSSPVPTPLHSTSRYSRSSVSLAYRTLPLPTPTPFSLVT